MPHPAVGGMGMGMGAGGGGSIYDEPGSYGGDRLGTDDYGVSPGGGGRGMIPGTSPYRRSSALLPPTLGPGGVPVYPAGHIYEGQPVPGGVGAISRSHSPESGAYGSSLGAPAMGGYGGISPRMPARELTEQQLLSSPDAFHRPINRAQTFTPFELMKIQDMDEFMDVIPRLPIVLTTHDVLPEDWGRLMGVRVSPCFVHSCL